MIRPILTFLSVALVTSLATVACSSGSSSGGGGAAGSGGFQQAPGCSTAPDCGSCSDCFTKCVCNTGQDDLCRPACGLGGAGGSSGVGGSGGLATGGSGGTPSENPLAADLGVVEISSYQTVKVALVQNGAEVADKKAPVVAGRPLLLRVFVTPGPAFSPRPIRAELALDGAGVLTDEKTINGPSNEAAMDTTFNFNLEAQQVTPSSTFAVTLREVTTSSAGADTAGARFPGQGAAPLGAQSTFGALDIVLVPMVVNGYTPDTGPLRVEAYKDRLYRMFPVDQLNITVRQPVNYPGGVSGSGQGWSSALDYLLDLRQSDSPPKDAYYFGLLTPAPSFSQFCGGACVAGLSVTPGANDVWGRGSLGLGFFPNGGNSGSTDTTAHELGHAHGLPHAPCGVNNAGPYPYAGGGIGSIGYDVVAKQFLNPSTFKDIMGYCDPSWISDFNYDRLFTRISYVNSTADWIFGDESRVPGRYRSILVEHDGSLSWGRLHRLSDAPMNEERSVAVKDDSGKTLAEVPGYFYPFAHQGGGILLVREQLLKSIPGAKQVAPAGLGRLDL